MPVHQNSIANLRPRPKTKAAAKKFTLTADTIAWLQGQKNMSAAIDELVQERSLYCPAFDNELVERIGAEKAIAHYKELYRKVAVDRATAASVMLRLIATADVAVDKTATASVMLRSIVVADNDDEFVSVLKDCWEARNRDLNARAIALSICIEKAMAIAEAKSQ